MNKGLKTACVPDFDAVAGNSGFLRATALIKGCAGKSVLFGDELRALSEEETGQLQRQGNTCDDWSRILVVDGFKATGIYYNTFQGDCRIGRFTSKRVTVDKTFSLSSGIYLSVIIDSEIGNDCIVHNSGVISNYIVDDGAVLLKNGSLGASSPCRFGNGVLITLGNETGGREIESFADLNLSLATEMAMRRDDVAYLDAMKNFTARYVEACTCAKGYVGKAALVRDCNTIEDTFIGEGAIVNGALLVKNSTLLSSKDERSSIGQGSYVSDSCIQWGSELDSMAIVERSLLCEYSSVERQGKVRSCVIGPNSAIAEGEMTSVLLGPFVGFHHQSLLIASLWPQGRGNVAYGANVGSNHTGRAPDQELWCGEGVFFGLGVNIKFPSDFSMAPYSVFATGVDTLPQRIEFPFSLINKTADVPQGFSASYNEIVPAWMLTRNIYALRRNELKYRQRNRARRSTFDFDVFRPQIIDLMLRARDALKSVSQMKRFYGDADIRGLGKNFMSEESRMSAIEAYQFFIEYYVLLQLFLRAEALLADGGKAALDAINTVDVEEGYWTHAAKIMKNEQYEHRGLANNLQQLITMINTIADSTFAAKERDDRRGKKIVPDYESVNVQAMDDDFVKETMKQTASLVSRVEKIITHL